MTASDSTNNHDSEAATREAFVFPTSFAQRRLWFLHQFDPSSPVYNIPVALRVTSPLNIDVLKSTLQEIVRRHDSLRTSFTSVDGEPFQVVAPSQPIELKIIDLRSSPQTEREAEAQRLASIDAQLPFSLSQGPLLRATLLVLGASDYVLLLTMHHIISDAWSMRVLYRELSMIYGAYVLGRPAPLPDLSIQYPDFANWQSQLLQGPGLAKHLDYWKTQLAGIPELLDLPTDRLRPGVQTHHGGVHALPLESQLYEQIRALAQREGMTQFMILLAAFKAILYRYTGETDVVVGTPIAGRTRPELENLIGFFVNTLVLRTDLSGDPTFRELLGRVREVTLAAYAHQDMPFEKLVEELQPARNLSHNSLFQVLFTLQASDTDSIQQSSAPTLEVMTGTAKFDLTLSVAEANRAAVLAFEYNTDLFEATTVELMAERLHRLLQNVATDPNRRLSELLSPTEVEQQQVLVEWNQTELDFASEECVAELFERQVERTPEAPALSHNGEQLTYRELNARANQLAHTLRQLGVGPEMLVGLYLPRSSALVVGLLATIKAGGAYLPLDPNYPAQRLAFMLDDARVPVLITQSNLLERLPVVQAQKLCLDTEAERIASQSDENPGPQGYPDALAYVLYTSGSTGKPKGVAIQQQSVVAFLHWARQVFGPDDLQGVMASTSICFDLSVFELLVPLCWGGRIILAEDALHLPSYDEAQAITLINTVPSAMAELIRIRGVPDSVRTVNLAGEPLFNSLVQQIYELKNVERVWNLYGPTEGTTYSTYALVAKGVDKEPCIGRPVANNKVYILNEILQPVPVGLPGDLYIAGAGLARGYLNLPALTAERFIPDPFSRKAGGRLYRTGDRARYRPDGQIEYLGRSDHQVKVRGYRIEPGEIEAALREQTGVTEAVVIVDQDAVGDKRLVAFIINGQMPVPSAAELRRALQDKLPRFMVPSDYVVLEKLPLLPNGKLDRRVLQGLDRPRVGGNEKSYVAPRSAIEHELATIFSEVLKLERIGVHDNFFEQGGHSLLATRTVSRVRQKYGVTLSLRQFFEMPTVEELARLISETQQPQTLPSLPITSSEVSREAAPDVSALSDDEVTSMLEALLTEGNGHT